MSLKDCEQAAGVHAKVLAVDVARLNLIKAQADLQAALIDLNGDPNYVALSDVNDKAYFSSLEAQIPSLPVQVTKTMDGVKNG